MKQYYYIDGTNRFGPLTLEELRSKNINRYTQVWHEGMSNWTAAENVAELKDFFFGTIPPPPGWGPAPDPFKRPPKNWLVESILVTIFCCLPFGIAGIVNAAKVDSAYRLGGIEEAERASANAKKWTMYSLWFGLAVGIIYFIAMLGGALSGIYY